MGNLLFSYGTLQWPHIIQAVIGRIPDSENALVRGYACYRVTGECYPGLIPEPDGITHGLVYFALTPAELRKLDRFEGPEYIRQRHPAELQSGVIIHTNMYVWKMSCKHRLSRRCWSREYFENSASHHSFSSRRMTSGS